MNLVRTLLILLTLGTSLATAAEVSVEHAVAIYDQAVKASADDPFRARALFAEAAASFDAIAASGHATAELYRAQGNAHLLADQPGPAVLAFRRALELQPTNRRAEQGLAAARKTVDTVAPPSAQKTALETLSVWRSFLHPGYVALTFAACWTIFWIALALPRFKGPAMPTPVLATLFFFAIASALALAVDSWAHLRDTAVVVMESTPAFNGPSREVYDQTFESPLSPGVEAEAIETRDGWTRIRLRSDQETWVPKSTLAWVRAQHE